MRRVERDTVLGRLMLDQITFDVIDLPGVRGRHPGAFALVDFDLPAPAPRCFGRAPPLSDTDRLATHCEPRFPLICTTIRIPPLPHIG
jgi:hypothetical protein